MDKLLSYLNIFWRTVKTDLRQMFLSRMEIAMWSPIRPRFTFYTRCHPKFTPLPPQVRRGQLYVYRYVQTYVRKSGSSQLLVDLLIGIVLCQVIQKCASSDDDFDIKIWYTIARMRYIYSSMDDDTDPLHFIAWFRCFGLNCFFYDILSQKYEAISSIRMRYWWRLSVIWAKNRSSQVLCHTHLTT